MPESNNPLGVRFPEVALWLLPAQVHFTVSPTVMLVVAGVKVVPTPAPRVTLKVVAAGARIGRRTARKARSRRCIGGEGLDWGVEGVEASTHDILFKRSF